jgi:hypothetical protein
MKKKGSSEPIMEQEFELEDTELPEQQYGDRILVLQREPLSRKTMLLHAGVQDIRCIWCIRVKALATAEELGDGWICEDCLSEMENIKRYGGQRGK